MTFFSYSPSYADWILFQLLRGEDEKHYLVIDDSDHQLTTIAKAFYDHSWKGIRILQNSELLHQAQLTYSRERHLLFSDLLTTNISQAEFLQTILTPLHLLCISSAEGLHAYMQLKEKFGINPLIVYLELPKLAENHVTPTQLASFQLHGYQLMNIGEHGYIFIYKSHTALREQLGHVLPFFDTPFISAELIKLRIQKRELADSLSQEKKNIIDLHASIEQKQIMLDQKQIEINSLKERLDDPLIVHHTFSALCKAVFNRLGIKLMSFVPGLKKRQGCTHTNQPINSHPSTSDPLNSATIESLQPKKSD